MNELSPEAVEELKRLEAKAAPGPWHTALHGDHIHTLEIQTHPEEVSDEFGWIKARTVLYYRSEEFDNAILLNRLRNAAPALIRAAEENVSLNKENEELAASIEAHTVLVENLSEIAQLRAQLAKAERALRAIVAAPGAVHPTVTDCVQIASNALADYSAKETE